MDELFIVGAGGYFTVAQTLLSANECHTKPRRTEGTRAAPHKRCLKNYFRFAHHSGVAPRCNQDCDATLCVDSGRLATSGGDLFEAAEHDNIAIV